MGTGMGMGIMLRARLVLSKALIATVIIVNVKKAIFIVEDMAITGMVSVPKNECWHAILFSLQLIFQAGFD